MPKESKEDELLHFLKRRTQENAFRVIADYIEIEFSHTAVEDQTQSKNRRELVLDKIGEAVEYAAPSSRKATNRKLAREILIVAENMINSEEGNEAARHLRAVAPMIAGLAAGENPKGKKTKTPQNR